jgi:hypothetical protein
LDCKRAEDSIFLFNPDRLLFIIELLGLGLKLLSRASTLLDAANTLMRARMHGDAVIFILDMN